MWSDTVGLIIRPASDQKNGLGVVKHGLVTLIVIMFLNNTATFQVLFVVFLTCAWNITTAEINSGVFYIKVKSANCLFYFRWCLVNFGLGLRVLFCLHHW